MILGSSEVVVRTAADPVVVGVLPRSLAHHVGNRIEGTRERLPRLSLSRSCFGLLVVFLVFVASVLSAISTDLREETMRLVKLPLAGGFVTDHIQLAASPTTSPPAPLSVGGVLPRA
jgi:hypothetical protein